MNSAVMLSLGALALTLTGAPAMSMEPVAPTYLLAMQIHDGNRLVGSPRLTIAAGQPSIIEISEKSGNHYKVTMTATAQPAGTIFIKSTIDVVSSGVHQSAAPNMLVALNKSSAIEFGTDSANSKPIRVGFTLNKAD